MTESDVSCAELAGSPAEVGAGWGHLNRAAICRDLEEQFLEPARQQGLAAADLGSQADAFARIAGDLAPHWLEEIAAIAAAAAVEADLYTAFVANVYRRLYLEPECTSWATRWEHNAGEAILFHKTRDNAHRDQAAFLLRSDGPGVGPAAVPWVGDTGRGDVSGGSLTTLLARCHATCLANN